VTDVDSTLDCTRGRLGAVEPPTTSLLDVALLTDAAADDVAPGSSAVTSTLEQGRREAGRRSVEDALVGSLAAAAATSTRGRRVRAEAERGRSTRTSADLPAAVTAAWPLDADDVVVAVVVVVEVWSADAAAMLSV